MISNPYPSPISLTAAQRTAMGFETQMQFWDSDLGWITPAPTGTVTVAVAQAFQVRVAGGVGATAIFTVDNSQRVATVGATFYKTDETSNYVNVTIGDGSYTNKTSIYFVDGATDAFDAAYKQLESSELGFKEGFRNSIEVLNAQQTLFNAEKDLFGAKYNYLMSIVNLKYFSGLIKDADLLEINQFLIK
jgi:hypothetical protein